MKEIANKRGKFGISDLITDKWVYRFLQLAKVYASWSRDPSTKVGCVLSKGNIQISQGYNGFSPRLEDRLEWLDNRELRLTGTHHAESNAFALCSRSELHGAGVFVTAPPCKECAKLIDLYGLSEVIYLEPSDGFKERWADDLTKMHWLFDKIGVHYVEISSDTYLELEKRYGSEWR